MGDILDIKNIEEINAEYVLICKDTDDIIEDIKFKDKKEEDNCRMIVDFIEKTIATGLAEKKRMQLPFVGILQYNPLDAAMSKHYTELKLARRTMSKDEYKEYAKDVYYTEKKNVKYKQVQKEYIRKLKSKNKKKYNNLCVLLGKTYADCYMYCMTLMAEVPFDVELQERYDELANRKLNNGR